MANCVNVPARVIRPIADPAANQSAPSGPRVMLPGLPKGAGTGNSVITPLGVMRAMLLLTFSANQMLPSGPGTRLYGYSFGWRRGNSAIGGGHCPVPAAPADPVAPPVPAAPAMPDVP